MPSGADHIATILRDARHKNSLSQRDLSAVSGVPQSHISKIEKGAVDLDSPAWSNWPERSTWK